MSLLTGLVSLYVATLGFFAIGVSISRAHMLAFLVPATIVAWLASPGKKEWGKILGLLLAQGLVAGILLLIAAQFDDLSYDGMWHRIEPTIAISAGWNPVQDPTGQTLPELAKTHPYLQGSVNAATGYQYTFGSIITSNLAYWTGNLNASKALTPLLVLAVFGIAYGSLASLSLPFGWSISLSLLAALNPVAIYQSSSFYVDGHTACLFTAMIFSALRLLVAPLDTVGVLAMVVAFMGLSAAKTSGIFYGVIIDVVFLVFYAVTHLKKLKPILIFVGISALVTWPIGMMFRKVGGFPDLSMAYLQSATNLATAGYGIGQNSFGLDVMPKLDRLQVFLMSYMAPTEVIATKPKVKFPFWLNRRELSLFEDLSPDARAGGFGPLYGGSLILAVVSLGFIFMGKPPGLASFFPVVPVLMSVSLTQTWWARWAPQGWLIPVALILPLLAAWKNQPPGKRWILPFLCLFTGLLNSLLILLFYSVGCVKAQRVLDNQLAFLKTLPQPLQVHMPMFLSNRIWLIREDLKFELIPEAPAKPRIKLHRTDTCIPLPTNWEENLGIGTKKAEWRKRKLIEE